MACRTSRRGRFGAPRFGHAVLGFLRDLDAIADAAREAGRDFEITVQRVDPSDPHVRAATWRSILGSRRVGCRKLRLWESRRRDHRQGPLIMEGEAQAEPLAQNTHREDSRPRQRGSPGSQSQRRPANAARAAERTPSAARGRGPDD
jgi:hypothetical protein